MKTAVKSMISGLARSIEIELSSKKVEVNRTFNTSEVIEWTVTTEDMCGCDITLIDHGHNHFGIELKPFVYNQWGDPVYFPNRMYIDSGNMIEAWFRQNFIYEIFYIKNFRTITQNIPNVAKDVGFDGVCLPSMVKHGQDERGIGFIAETIEFEDIFNGIKKKINVTVNAFQSKIVISSQCDGPWETISKEKDAKRALAKFKKRMHRYIEQYSPQPRYYLMLLQNPKAFGENVEVFPVIRTKLNDEYK